MRDYWKMVLAAMLLNLLIAFLTPILAIFVQNIGEKNVLFVGYAFAASFMTQGILSVIFGKLADKYGRKKFLILGNLIFCAVPFIYIFITNVYQIILVSILGGIGLGMAQPAYYALFAEKMKQGKRGSGYGIWNSGITFVTGVGALVGASIAQFLGFQALFVFMGIIQLIQTTLIATVREK